MDHSTGNVYDLIDGGWADPITQITGQAVTPYDSSDYNASSWAGLKSIFVTAIEDGEEVDFASFGTSTISGMTAFVSGHMYSGIGYDATTGDFTVRNPWGTEAGQSWLTEFEASISDLFGVNGDIFIATGNTGATPPNTAGVHSNIVTDESEFNAAIAQFDVGGSQAAVNAAYTIDISQSFTLNAALQTIDLPAGSSLVINVGLLYVFNSLLGIYDLYAVAISTVLTFIGGFVLSKGWVFKPAQKKQRPALEGAVS